MKNLNVLLVFFLMSSFISCNLKKGQPISVKL